MSKISPTFAELEKELADATTASASAEQAESLARVRATDARNRVNAAQRAVDMRVAEMKKAAPAGSDWSKMTATPRNA